MFLLFGHGVVSETNNSKYGWRQGSRFRRRSREAQTPTGFPKLQLQFAEFPSVSQIQTFNCKHSDRALVDTLRGDAFHFVVQDNSVRDFLHGFSHLLALPLHGSIRFFLADFQLALKYAFGALDDFAGF